MISSRKDQSSILSDSTDTYSSSDELRLGKLLDHCDAEHGLEQALDSAQALPDRITVICQISGAFSVIKAITPRSLVCLRRKEKARKDRVLAFYPSFHELVTGLLPTSLTGPQSSREATL